MQTNVNAKKDSKLTKINFEKFAKDVQNVSEKTVSNSQRATIYIYPENWNALQINSSEGKGFRTKRRKELFNFCNLIQLHYKMKKGESLLEEIKNFNIFYKKYFKVNDYSINSITSTKGELNAEYQKMLNIIKDVSFASEKEAAPKKKAVKAKKEVAKEVTKEVLEDKK